MRKLIDAIRNATTLAEPHSSSADPASPLSLGRPDRHTAHCIEVGLIIHAMLGATTALDYLARQSVNPKVAQRVLSASGRRRRNDAGTTNSTR
jgi:hypothetical protein